LTLLILLLLLNKTFAPADSFPVITGQNTYPCSIISYFTCKQDKTLALPQSFLFQQEGKITPAPSFPVLTGKKTFDAAHSFSVPTGQDTCSP
jgi:hypothetical protein